MSTTESPVAPATFCFGELELDEARRQLLRGGVVVAMEPKPFELLIYLIRQRDRVVRRDELMKVLWPDVVVSDASLSTCVARAREAIQPLGDCIQGVRKIGYRFVGELRDSIPSGPSVSAGEDSARSPRPGELPFVGRQRELERMTEALERSLRGNGSLVALIGEPGIGKTRIIEELVQRARQRGVEALIGYCYEGEAGQAFWPWVQVLRAFAASRPSAELEQALGAEATDILRLTSAASAAATESAPVDPAMSRTRLFDAVAAVLRRAAERRPLLIVLDDLHWADTASATLLQILARQLSDRRMLVVTAYRDIEVAADHPLASLLSTLRREGTLETIGLAGLSLDESGDLLRAMAGARVETSTLEAMRKVTEGNPFFLGEYWRHLVEEQAVVRDELGWVGKSDGQPLKLPAGVRDVVARRLQRLTPECVQVLTIGAVVGRDFEHGIVSDVATVPERDVIDLLDEAARTRVIDESPDTAGQYRFVHALVRETLYEGMTRLRRSVLHRLVGESLERRSPGERTRAQIVDLAHHFREAAAVGEPLKAIDYARQAAIDATQAYAYDVAVGYLDSALQTSRRRESDIPRIQVCKLTLELAEALERAGDGERMRIEFARAADLAREIGAPQLLARAAIGMSSPWLPEDAPAIPLLEEALTVLPATEVALRVQAQARLAQCLYMVPDSRVRREQLCGEARAKASQLGDSRIEAEVLAGCLEATFHCDGLAQQEELTADLHVAAEAAADPRTRLLARAWRIVNAMRRGELRQADEHLADFSQLAGALRQPRFLAHAASFDAALLLARGKLGEAEARSQEALRIGHRMDETAAAWVSWAQLYFIRREQGRFAEFLAAGTVRSPAVAPKAAAAILRSSQWAPPHVFSELGDFDRARDAYHSLLQLGLDQLPPEDVRNTRISALFSMADACAALDERGVEGELYDLLLPYQEQWNVTGWGAVVISSTHLMLAGLRGVQRRWQDADDHFVEAARLHRDQGALCALARTLAYHARMLQRRARRGDYTRARELCRQGLALTEPNGLEGVGRQIHATLDALE